jgi:membrane dipeptidase
MDFSQQQWIDAHLDLAYLAEGGRDLTRPSADAGGLHVPGAVSFPSLAEAHFSTVLGTIFISRHKPELNQPRQAWHFQTDDEAFAFACRQLEHYERWHQEGHIQLYPRPEHAGALRVILLMEGAAGIRSIDDLQMFQRRGVRMLSLCWNDGTRYAGGDFTGGPLTDVGRALVREIDRLGIIHDVSHLSEEAFWTLMDLATGPRVASHSNCRALLPGKAGPERHLSDAQIKAIVAARGMIGINLFSRFLVVDGRAEIADVVRHIVHITQLAGSADCVGLGSDMDGGFSTDHLPRGLEEPKRLPRLLEALATAGFSDGDLANFAFGNWRRFLNAHFIEAT